MNLDQRSTDHPESLAVAVRRQGTTTVIELDGEWDLDSLSAAQRAFASALEAVPECVVLDLSRLALVDASGVRATVELARQSRQQGSRLVIIPGPVPVQHAFELAEVTEELPFIEPLGWEITGPEDGLLESRPRPGAPRTMRRGRVLERPRPVDQERPSTGPERAVIRELRLFNEARMPKRRLVPKASTDGGSGPRAA